ncbi:MAG: toll/interleukin-1 receptor domain-containing protein [Acidobacteriota bacterium]
MSDRTQSNGFSRENAYRVFISYSHQDFDLVAKIVAALEDNGLIPMWDQKFAFGYGFHEQIKSFIAHAHAFVPVITESSHLRGWVHQEIGYAMALNVPVLPVSVGAPPGEMIQSLHALQFCEDPEELRKRLSRDVVDNLVSRYCESQYAFYECAELAEDRARMMVEYSEAVIELGYTGRVRQKGALSSFHIPKKIITDKVWDHRYGKFDRSPFHRRQQRRERMALEKHARASGCRIIIDPSITYRKYGPKARMVRLGTLVEFLESMTDDMAEVAILEPGAGAQESITIVGDWFYAESVSASIGKGYRQTIFTRHAPSMRGKIELFDQEFEEQLQREKWTARSSRREAIKRLKKLMGEIHDNRSVAPASRAKEKSKAAAVSQ